MGKKNQIILDWSGRLQQLRESMELTQEQFAKELNFSKQQIARFETRRTKPSFDLLKKLASQYDINVNWLISGYGRKTRTQIIKDDADLTAFSTPLLEEELQRRKILRDSVINNIKQGIKVIQNGGYTDIETLNNEMRVVVIKAIPKECPQWLVLDIVNLYKHIPDVKNTLLNKKWMEIVKGTP